MILIYPSDFCETQHFSRNIPVIFEIMKRTKEEIIVKVLESCLNGPGRTAIVYGCNLNFNTVKPYINSLIKGGYIIAVEGPPRRYETTDKGKELLNRLKEVHEFF